MPQIKERLDQLYDATDKGSIKWQCFSKNHFFCFFENKLIELAGWIQPYNTRFYFFESDLEGFPVLNFNDRCLGARLLVDLYRLVASPLGQKQVVESDRKLARLCGAGSRVKNIVVANDRNYLPEIVNFTATVPLVENIRSIVENLFDNRQTKGPEDTLSGILVSLLKSSNFFLRHTFFEFIGYYGLCPNEIEFLSGKAIAGALPSVIRPDIWIKDKNDIWSPNGQIPPNSGFNIIVECKFGAKFTANQLNSLGPLKTALTAAGGHCKLLHIGNEKVDPLADPFKNFGGNPFDYEITWQELIEFAKKDLQRYCDGDSFISIALIQALDTRLGNVAKIGEIDSLVEVLIKQIKRQWKVKARRERNHPYCIQVENKMLVDIQTDFSIFLDEKPYNQSHQTILGHFLYRDLRVGSKDFSALMSNLRQFYDAI